MRLAPLAKCSDTNVKIYQSVATQIRRIIDYQFYSPRSPEGGQAGKRDFYDNSQNTLTKKTTKAIDNQSNQLCQSFLLVRLAPLAKLMMQKQF